MLSRPTLPPHPHPVMDRAGSASLPPSGRHQSPSPPPTSRGWRKSNEQGCKYTVHLSERTHPTRKSIKTCFFLFLNCCHCLLLWTVDCGWLPVGSEPGRISSEQHTRLLSTASPGLLRQQEASACLQPTESVPLCLLESSSSD